uniref:Transmembrane protein n=1 Tax=Panagrellus redivivus TaxID=6233 RepID=A0A7E4V2C0_PANRE
MSNTPKPAKPAKISIRPDYDTDVLWKPPRMGTRQRTISTDSTDDMPAVSPTQRRFSLSGMLLGATAGIGGLVRQGSQTSGTESPPKKMSITETVDFKEFMRRQSRALSDEDGFGFNPKDYRRE